MLLLFPEGTRNGIEKKGKLQNGAVLISLMSGGTPIVPIGIQAKKLYKPFSKVIINIGKPIDFSEYKDKQKEKEVLDSLSSKLMDEMIKLTNEKI